MCNAGRGIARSMIHDRNYLRRQATSLTKTDSDKWKRKLIKDITNTKSLLAEHRRVMVLHVSDCKGCNNLYAPLLSSTGRVLV